jgi:hypothetical protein
VKARAESPTRAVVQSALQRNQGQIHWVSLPFSSQHPSAVRLPMAKEEEHLLGLHCHPADRPTPELVSEVRCT